MSEPFIGEIKMWGGNYAPKGYAFAAGQLLPIAQNTMLYALIGVTYGGDGRTTFGLPNFAGRVPMGVGSSPGGPTYALGELAGETAVTLTNANMPSHNHTMQANFNIGDIGVPAPSEALCQASGGDGAYSNATTTNLVALAPEALTPFTGGMSPHNNLQPYLGVTFLVALEGVFPAHP